MASHLIDVNFYLETINGSITILLSATILFFVMYLADQRRLRGLTWRELVFDPPVGVALALPMITIKIGLLVARGSLWIWRQFSDGGYMPLWELGLTLIGTVITAIGLLWMLRVLSRPRFGDWPWIISASSVLTYVIANSVGLIP